MDSAPLSNMEREKIRRAHYPAHNGFGYYCRDGCVSADVAGVCDAIRALDALETAEKQFEVSLELAATENAQLRTKVADLEREVEKWSNYAADKDACLDRAEAAERWKTAVLDLCVVNWTSWDENNPRVTLRNLIAQEVLIALDPLVSQGAAELVARGRREGFDAAIGIVKEMDEWDAGLVEDLELARDEPPK